MRKFIMILGIAALIVLPIPNVDAEQVGVCKCRPLDGGVVRNFPNMTSGECALQEANPEIRYSCSWTPTTGAEITAGDETNGAGITGGLGSGKPVNLSNPLGTDNVKLLIGRVIRTILGVVGSISLIIFVYGGLLWTTSAGNPDQVKKGRDTLLWAAIGLTIIFTSYTLVSFLLETVTQVS